MCRSAPSCRCRNGRCPSWAVGTLLYCHFAGLPISRRWDQPANGGGNFYGFELNPPRVHGTWQPIDVVV